ncbi:tail fiber domain-containing protein [Chryseobacterium limigenitum]|uniref:Chaperone of endosialidase n=1 Tax=Chryseobacterium limigenitum TaxID=1612149 RepID=A0A1K2IWL4_9FLAO|nr:tail fiber domain-containing protein [Chryseobacterium limigenitum]SFZ96825.1 Chaperone of endosialidase [Chryseobacterium limigenitum]
MKKKLIILFTIFCFGSAFTQVGIHTQNPQGIFHIDGAKDNPATGVPNAAQQSNDLIMLNNGYVGMGTILPKQQLHITELNTASGITNSFISGIAITGNAVAAGFSGPGLYLENVNAPIGSRVLKINYTQNATEPFLNFQTVSDNAGTSIANILSLTRSGRLGVGTTSPTEKLHVIGNILASGTITPSDIRIKKDITDNPYGLKEVLNLRTINYRYKNEELGKDRKVGFIAQEIKVTMPELVTTANDEIKTLGVNYAEMTVILTKAIQEQQKEIELLKEQIKILEKKIK